MLFPPKHSTATACIMLTTIGICLSRRFSTSAFTISTRTSNPLRTAPFYPQKYQHQLLQQQKQQQHRPFVRMFSSPPTEEEIDPGAVEGTSLRIVKYPHPSLRAENAEITEDELASGEISRIAKEMFLLMYAAEGVGLAAPQVGINKRLMVYNPTGDKNKWLSETVLVNPKIVTYSEGRDVENEGCLSFPDTRGDVERSKWIKVEAQNLKGKKIKKKFTDWEARIFQHEYDHLEGTVYIDHLSEEGRNEVQPTLDKLIDDFGDGGSL